MHYERPGAERPPYRVVEQKGKRVELTLGRASEEAIKVSLSFPSAAAAAREAEVWSRRARCVGFSGFDIPTGVPGLVFAVKGPGGPGRVRIDGSEDVLFPAGSAEVPKLKVGLRVVAEGLHETSARPPDFMFGSRWVAERLRAFPKPSLPPISIRPLSAPDRRALVKLAGPALQGHQRFPQSLRRAKPGELIFGFQKGVHRFIRTTKRPDVEVVIYEPVFTSDFKFTSGFLDECIPEFCAPIPAELSEKLRALVPDLA